MSQSATPKLLSEPKGGVPDVTGTPDAFDRALDMLAAGTGPVAADAERASGFRYGHEDWLIQLKRQGTGIVLLDPVNLVRAGCDLPALNDVFAGEEWILHDALMDLPGFAALGLRPDGLFDTEVAARLLGATRFGLAAVTERYLGLTLAKEHSAADWSYRPLPRDWRNYAALDVELLVELRARLRAELRAAGKDGWAAEEFAYLLRKGMTPPAQPSEPWRGTSRISLLSDDPQGLAVVRDLWNERDRHARELDIAPGLLLPDRALIEAGLRKPHNAREFRQIRILNERVRMFTGSEQDAMYARYAPLQRKVKPSLWRETIKRTLALPADRWPSATAPAGERRAMNAPRSMKYWQTHHPGRYERYERARKVVAGIAQDTNTPADVLLKPQYLRNLCWSDEAMDADAVRANLAGQGARDWQCSLLGASIARVLE